MQVARIVNLADQIAKDIELRGLKPGDAYFGTEKTARMLRVSAAAANRALQVLVKRGVLHRRQGLGTFIAQLPGEEQSPLNRVRLLVREDFFATEGLLDDGVLMGMQAELPGASLQIDFVPPGDGQDFVEQLVSESLQAPHSEGFVLIRSSFETQRIVKASGLPAVVYGTPFPSMREMAWLDRDHRQIGQLLADHLLAQGFRRMVVMLRQHMSPGDYLALDHVQQVFAACGLGLEDVVLRCVPSAGRIVSEEVIAILEADCRPTGFLCRNEPLAGGVAAARDELGRSAEEVGIVMADVYRKASSPAPRFPYTRPEMTPEQIGESLGRMLALQAIGTQADSHSQLVPVRLELPTNSLLAGKKSP